MNEPDEKKHMDRLFNLLAHADQPFDEDCVNMDCSDGCEEIALLADRVANGESIELILPAYADHMQQIGCCKEEFDALVSVIEAEKQNKEASDNN